MTTWLSAERRPLPIRAAQRLTNLSAQVDAYLANRLIFPFASFGRDFSPTTAAAIFIGGDDILHERPDTRAEASSLANRVVSSVGREVVKLAGAGFGHFLLYTLGKL